MAREINNALPVPLAFRTDTDEFKKATLISKRRRSVHMRLCSRRGATSLALPITVRSVAAQALIKRATACVRTQKGFMTGVATTARRAHVKCDRVMPHAHAHCQPCATANDAKLLPVCAKLG